jgi:hypothetical protein
MSQDTPVASAPKRKRHKWAKVRSHVYVCAKCGTGKVNAFDERSFVWTSTWHKADGGTQVDGPTPPCEAGVRTSAALVKYAVEIAAARGEKVELR